MHYKTFRLPGDHHGSANMMKHGTQLLEFHVDIGASSKILVSD